MSAGLTDKQAAFVREYLIDLNATQAAIRAGYSEHTAGAIGHENLNKPEIAEAIKQALAERAERVEVSADWVLECLMENVERSMQRRPVLDNKGEPTGEWKYEGSVANKALELLGKHCGLFSDNLNLRTPDGPVEIIVKRQIVRPNGDG